MRPLLFESYTYETIWAGHRLEAFRRSSDKIGTSFEVSAHPTGSTRIANIEGQPLFLDYLKGREEALLGPDWTIHDLMRTCFLDTSDVLSVQVHPDDDYAQLHSHDDGKDESWYIVDADEDAFLYAGATTKNLDVLHQALEKGTIQDYMRKWHVHAGDYIDIPHGTLHALGANILAYEMGTNSNTTYRFYDWDRVDANGQKRPLHIKESFDVVDLKRKPHFVRAQKTSHRLSEMDHYVIDELYINSPKTINCGETYFIITNIEKEPIDVFVNNETIPLEGYKAMFVPYITKQIHINKAHLLLSRPRKESL